MWGAHTHLYFYSVGIAGLPGFPLRCWGSRISSLGFHMRNFIDRVMSLFLPYSFRSVRQSEPLTITDVQTSSSVYLCRREQSWLPSALSGIC